MMNYFRKGFAYDIIFRYAQKVSRNQKYNYLHYLKNKRCKQNNDTAHEGW